MWCPHCKSETAAEGSRSSDDVSCANCGNVLQAGATSAPTIRQARDIIAKWSSSDLLDQISALPPIPPMPRPHVSEVMEAKPEANADDTDEPRKKSKDFAPPDVDESASSKSSDTRATAENEPPKPLAKQVEAGSVAPRKPEKPSAEKPETVVESKETKSTGKQRKSEEVTSLTPMSVVPAARPQELPKSEQSVAAPIVQSIEAPSAATGEKKTTKESGKGSRPRAKQSRAPQPRKQRERKHSAEAVNKGSNPVSRKFRVDTPGGESAEAPEEINANVAGTRIQSNSSSGRRHRIDTGEPLEATLDTANDRVRTQNRPRRRYIDEPHESAVRGPHFQVTVPKRSNLTSMTGQFLAYLGVLGLTIGTAIVIYGHFGGYSQYTPTGWLVTTVAQMMLFLGVINLVSGGIEQTNDDVSARINTLGEQLLRIEQVTEAALRGPKISAQRYANPDAEVEERERETAGLRERE